MASLGVDGLVSGLDTTALINQLMQVEAVPQNLLKTKQSTASSLVTALQALNAKVASLAESAQKAAKAEGWQAAKATSSHESVTASVAAGATAMAGEVTFTVEQLATSKIMTSAGVALADPIAANGASLTITRGDGTTVSVRPASGSLQDVAAAINADGDAGVRATVVRAGSDADGGALYALQLTGTDTGATDGNFAVAGLATPLQVTRTPQDARVRLEGVPTVDELGDPVDTTIEQASNSFTDLMLGVDVTLSADSVGESVTVSVARDDEALMKLGSDLVASLGVVLSEITSRTASTTTTADDGRTVVSGGLFSGDSAVRDLQQQVSRAASYPVDGVSPAEVGIVVGRDGAFTFDAAKFAEALAADPAKVQSVVAGLAQRVADVASAASDSIDGTLTLKITAQEGQVKDLGDQIADWDLRLASRREGLQRTYAQLEVALSNLQSQSTWLSGQLASLSTGSAG